MHKLLPTISKSATIERIGSLVSWRRPKSYWAVTVMHLPLAFIFGTALLLPHVAALNQLPLIPCTFLHFTGYPCPLCGITRAFWAIADGQWSLAMANCPLAFLIAFIALAMFAWHFTALLFGVVLSPGPALRTGPAGRRIIFAVVLLSFMLNWIYRLTSGLT